ncbi:proton-conducting transporter transmembrane domain-containing protein [Halonotius pteroides]|uniref:Oxidoreductase n=1 Tax=Halonotius pteroides TaxID=268735 RepID=A0A3A6QN61_9EURY|nr:proton-conducting transporter membrane subunit [Halonotius pteroides]RJX49665.1 oxidoreductase [Halonotius pteroides]
MTDGTQRRSVGSLPEPNAASSRVPAALTRFVWAMWLGTLAVVAGFVRTDPAWAVDGLVAIDGLTVVMWSVVTFFSGIVHSYSRRYLDGNPNKTQFFVRIFAFTIVVMVVVAADHIALFAAAWLAMGLLMAELIGHVDGWPQARAAARSARRYFVGGSLLVAFSLTLLWSATGATSVTGILDAVGGLSTTTALLAAGGLVVAAMIQSALIPFHTWVLSSMTAPTPASALMHAGFVNAGGVLLVRFAPVVTVEPTVMLAIVAIGAASALGGKLLKSVQPDIKGQLGCSTVGQMGFMLMQAGLGFFPAAIAHLILHGFYKAYQFLSSGGAVEHTTPQSVSDHTVGFNGVGSIIVTLATGLLGGALFAVLTGKGTLANGGILLTFFVTFATLHAARSAVKHTTLPATLRYGAVPLVFFPAIIVYGAAYEAISFLLADLPVVTATTELTLLHGAIAVVFVGTYLAIETGVHEESGRLYVALLNLSQPVADTLLTTTEDYNEY